MAKGRKAGTSKTALTVKFHVVFSPTMKELLRDIAQARNVSEGHIVREALAEKLGLDRTHVDSIQKHAFVPRSTDVEPVSTKRMFHDVPHPLEAALRRVSIPDDEEESNG